MIDFSEMQDIKEITDSKKLTLAEAKKIIKKLIEHVSYLDDAVYSLEENISDLEDYIEDLEKEDDRQ